MAGIKASFRLNGTAGDVRAATLKRLQGDADDAEKRIAYAHTGAMQDVMKTNLAILRADVAAGGFYNGLKLSKTWQGRVYPSGGFSVEPAAYIFNKANVIIDAFELGVTITVQNRQYLAVPVGPAKAIIRELNKAQNRGRDDSGRFVDEAGTVERVATSLGYSKLIPKIDKALGAGVLVAPGKSLNDRARRDGKSQDTVLFILTKTATLKQRIRGRQLLAQFDTNFEAQFTAGISVRLSEMGSRS
jgi:hypothetical protein